MVDLSVDLLGMRLENPTVLASGILGVTKGSLKFCARHGAGAVVIKSITREPRKGHPPPIVCASGGGLLNAVGYSNPGYRHAMAEYEDLADVGVPVIGSFVAETAEEYVFLAEHFANHLEFDAVEIPLSCPHTPRYGELAGHSGTDITYEIVSALKASLRAPLIVKLSANLQDIGPVAKAAEDAGADAITAVNTLGPGTCFEAETGRRVLGFGFGGMSGPPLKPVALKAVFDTYQAVKIPIIGTGGVSTGQDAVEMIMAGATAVGVGTAVVPRGVDVFRKICEEMEDLLAARGCSSLAEIRGRTHGKQLVQDLV